VQKVNRHKSTVVLILLFVLHAAPWLVRPYLIGGDEPHYALMAHSIAVDHDIDLTDDYQRVAEGSKAAGAKRAGTELDPHLRSVGDRKVFSHPLGLPILAAPLIALQQVVLPGSAPDFLLGLFGLAVTFAALLAGRDLLNRLFGVGDIALGLYFSSPLWFYSRTFFTEPFIWSAGVLALWLIDRKRDIAGTALFGIALSLKESALLAVAPVLFAFAISRGWKRTPILLAGPVVVAGIWIVKNIAVYGRAFETFQPFRMGDPLRGLLGVLFSPYHGLLVFAPIAILAILGLPRRESLSGFLTDPVVVAWMVFLLYLGLTSCWKTSGGGSCYGPRLMIPAIASLAIPLAEAWRRHHDRKLFRNTFAFLLVAGFSIQLSVACKPYHLFWSPSIGKVMTATIYGPVAGLIIGALLTRVLLHRLNRDHREPQPGTPPRAAW
jgi:hypothetical protein